MKLKKILLSLTIIIIMALSLLEVAAINQDEYTVYLPIVLDINCERPAALKSECLR